MKRTSRAAEAVALALPPASCGPAVYQLNPDDSRKARNFLRVSHEEIRLLDKEYREIKTKMNLSLRRTAGEGE